MSKKYTDEELLDELRRFYKENGRSPVCSDFMKQKEYPSVWCYVNRFGSWNISLLLAGLEINVEQISVNPGNYCEICGTTITREWRNKNEKRVCCNCARNDRKFVDGVVDPNSYSGFGIIGEYIVSNVLDNCIWFNNSVDTFNYKYDIYDEKYNNINVKCSTYKTRKLTNGNYWSFNIKYNHNVPDYYILLAFSKNKNDISHIWAIPANNILIKNKLTLLITNSDKSLSKYNEYELTADPFNNVYKHMNLSDIFHFRNLNKSEEVSV